METAVATKKIKLGLVGVGWIGRNSLEGVASGEHAAITAVCDSNPVVAKEVCQNYGAEFYSSDFEDILEMNLDGIVLATPSALHADQSIMALNAGIPVFCQKPLGRDLAETTAVVNAARDADKLLGVDLSYRHTCFHWVYHLVLSKELGDIYAVDLVFHNAYGPDKSWFYDPQLSGGGCVLDLGIHLVDLALWTLGYPETKKVSSSLYHHGRLIEAGEPVAEDFAVVQMQTENGTSISLNCSWNLSAGKDAEIEAVFYGTKGAAAFKNVNGSFYDFKVEKYLRTSSYLLCQPQENWGVRAINQWVKQLAVSDSFDPEAYNHLRTAEILDKIYGRI